MNSRHARQRMTTEQPRALPSQARRCSAFGINAGCEKRELSFSVPEFMALTSFVRARRARRSTRPTTRCRAYFISKAKTCSRTNTVVVALLQLVSRRSEERRRRKLVGRLVARRFSFLQRFVQWRNPLYRILTPPLRQALPPALSVQILQ